MVTVRWSAGVPAPSRVTVILEGCRPSTPSPEPLVLLYMTTLFTASRSPGWAAPSASSQSPASATVPEGAAVTVAGDPAGTTPLAVGDVLPGKRSLSITKFGYRGISRVIDFKADKTVELSLTLEPMTREQIDSAAAAEDARRARTDPPAAQPRDTAARKGSAAAGKKPEPIVTPQPPHPALAKAKRIDGKATVKMLVEVDGAVIAAEIAKSSGDESLDQAAREAALQWQFTPALSPAGKPVRAWFSKEFTFTNN